MVYREVDWWYFILTVLVSFFLICILIVPYKNVLVETLFILRVDVVNRVAGDRHRNNESARCLNLVWMTGLYVMTNRVMLYSCTVSCNIKSVEKTV
jgi:hypothetical protein